MKHILAIALLLTGMPASAQNWAADKYALVRYDSANAFYANNEIFPTGAKATALTEAEVAKVKAMVDDCINTYNQKQKSTFVDEFNADADYAKKRYQIDVAEYKLQLIAVNDKKGEKIVYVNAFCSTPPAAWKKEVYLVFDGGKCYFQLVANLNTNKYTDFVVEEQH
jgi:hypothetical protein